MNLLKNLIVDDEEFEEIAQYLCVVSAKFESIDEIFVLPIISLKSSYLQLLVTDNKINQYIKESQKVSIKFYRFAFEFILNGEISSIDFKNSTVKIKLDKIIRRRNYRQFLRYDVNLKAQFILDDRKGSTSEVLIKDISQYGASFKSSNLTLKAGQSVNIEINFENDTKIVMPSKILREQNDENVLKALEFDVINEEVYYRFIEELRKIEKEHLLAMIKMREFQNKTKKCNKKIVLYSLNCDVIYYLIGLSILHGIENYDVYSDFRTLKKHILISPPDAILVEIGKMNDDVLCVLKYVKAKLKGIPLIMILPYNFSRKYKIYEKEFEDAFILNKPTSSSEFEQCLKNCKIID